MDSTPRKLPPKRSVVLDLLEKSSVRIFLDPRREGVVVPGSFSRQAELVLRIGHALSPRIPDLDVGEDALSCTLSFNRAPSWCKVPFAAVYAVICDADGRGVVWPEDVPIESQLLQGPKPRAPRLDAAAEDRGAHGTGPAPAPRTPSPKRLARPAVPVSASQRAKSAPPPAREGDKPRRQLPPYLRVVK